MPVPTIPSGLGATLGVGKETTFGTFAPPVRWFLIDASEGFAAKKNVVQSKGLHGTRIETASRRKMVSREAQGKFTVDAASRTFGLLLQNMLGCQTPVVSFGVTDAAVTTVSGSPVITSTNNFIAEGVTTGMVIAGTGIPVGTTVLSVGSGAVTMSANATAAGSALSVTFNNFPVAACTLVSGSTTATTTGNFLTAGVSPGMVVRGTGLPASPNEATVVSVTATSLTLSAPATTGGTALSLTFGIYVQVFNIGLTQVGLGLSFQKGVPETPSGVMQAFSYRGSKILDWEFEVKRNDLAKFTFTTDGIDEDPSPAYVAPTFIENDDIFHFGEGIFTLGGIVPTAIISSVLMKGVTKSDVQRINIGSFFKSEQIENDFIELTCETEFEFANVTDYYTASRTDAPFGTLVYGFVSNLFPSWGIQFCTQGTAVFADSGSPQANTMGPVLVKVPFRILDDMTMNPLTCTYTTTDPSV